MAQRCPLLFEQQQVWLALAIDAVELGLGRQQGFRLFLFLLVDRIDVGQALEAKDPGLVDVGSGQVSM